MSGTSEYEPCTIHFPDRVDRFRGIEAKGFLTVTKNTGESDRWGRLPRFLRSALHARGLPVLAVPVMVAALMAGLPVARSAAIINGNTPEPAPSWAVALIGKNGHRCSGVLIAPNLVLTAKHCVGSPQDIGAVIGRGNLVELRQGETVGVEDSYPHDTSDLAVLRLGVSTGHTPIQRSPDDVTTLSGEIPLTLYGYGRNTEVSAPYSNDNLLHSASYYAATGLVNQISDPSCSRFVRPRFCLTPVSIQAGCSGDSGGPIVNPQGQLTGIYTGSRLKLGIDLRYERCLGTKGLAESTGHAAVTNWITDMIQKHEVPPPRQ